MCGVLLSGRQANGKWRGSSPHVRGFGTATYARRAPAGFIPACAGFCCLKLCFCRLRRVHPRMCGVLRTEQIPAAAGRGSSPHVRGFDGLRSAFTSISGFIPACAGFCLPSQVCTTGKEVHPRMCGVLISLVGHKFLHEGSSPHVRGFALRQRQKRRRDGFIPACAGF